MGYRRLDTMRSAEQSTQAFRNFCLRTIRDHKVKSTGSRQTASTYQYFASFRDRLPTRISRGPSKTESRYTFVRARSGAPTWFTVTKNLSASHISETIRQSQLLDLTIPFRFWEMLLHTWELFFPSGLGRQVFHRAGRWGAWAWTREFTADYPYKTNATIDNLPL